MRTSLLMASILAGGAGVTGASAALTIPYQGADTLFNVTRTAIDNTRAGVNTAAPAAADPGIGPSSTYVGGGSDNGQSAMAAGGGPATAATQQTAPMSRMVDGSGSVCAFNGDATRTGAGLQSASGIVVGLESVEVFASRQNGAQQTPSCNQLPNGVSQSGNTAVPWASGSPTGQTWKWVLALIYGGKDLSMPATPADCGSAARIALVNTYANFIQGQACSPNTMPPGSGQTAANVCGPGSAPNGSLWHAFRRDDASATSGLFASLLGLTPSTSYSALHGFGTSPYCNAINWDPSALNANCAYGPHDQWTGPGGVKDPSSAVLSASGANVGAGNGDHRRPPPGTWGDHPDPSQTTNSADVLPTQMQDNDPVRRRCLGSTTNTHLRAGEEVCNLDGALGLVLPMVDSDWVLNLNAPNNKQYPTNACTGFTGGKAPSVFTCPIRNTAKHSGECPNGDSLIGGACSVPIDVASSTSQCVSTTATIAPIHARALGNAYGRIFNLAIRDGSVASPTIGYAQYPDRLPRGGGPVQHRVCGRRREDLVAAVERVRRHQQ